MRNRILAGFVALGILFGGAVQAMTSTNFSIGWDSVNSGGDDVSSSTNYGIRDTIGEQATGFSSSTNFTLSAGYRTGDQNATALSFEIGTQQNGTQTAFSAFSNGSKTVTVASASGYSVDDLIGVVENVGLGQIIAVGRISDIAGLVITVDEWDGSPGSISASPAGGDDYVYRLGGSSAALGTLTTTGGNTSLTATEVASDAPNGYTVYVSDDGNLRSGSDFITNVSDGTVTIGSEEYGWRVFGSMATSTGSDLPFATTTTPIQTSTTTAPIAERVGLVYKAAISSGTPAGTYTHLVYYTVTANY